MSAKIYSPARTAMQSGKAKTGSWIVEFAPEKPRRIEPLMGYTSSSDMQSQVRLKFPTKEAAIAYCQREGLAYSLQEPRAASRRRVAYSDNFSYSRKQPWTH